MRKILFFLFVLQGVLSSPLYANSFVNDYFASIDNFQAKFIQQVSDSNGRALQSSEGRMWIKTPGRFRWDYHSPYKQQLVATGEKLWVYDEDLEQVTVQSIGEVLSSTPAMLLSGYRPLAEVMKTTQLDSEKGFDWYQLTPIKADDSVESIRIAFTSKELSVIEVVDGFGNHTQIRFSEIYRNVLMDLDRFKFTPPPGVDVIGSAGGQ